MHQALGVHDIQPKTSSSLTKSTTSLNEETEEEELEKTAVEIEPTSKSTRKTTENVVKITPQGKLTTTTSEVDGSVGKITSVEPTDVTHFGTETVAMITNEMKEATEEAGQAKTKVKKDEIWVEKITSEAKPTAGSTERVQVTTRKTKEKTEASAELVTHQGKSTAIDVKPTPSASDGSETENGQQTPTEQTVVTVAKSAEQLEEEELESSVEMLNVKQLDSSSEVEKGTKDELVQHKKDVKQIDTPIDINTGATIQVKSTDSAKESSEGKIVEITVEKITSSPKTTEVPTEQATKTKSDEELEEEELHISVEKLNVKQRDSTLEDEKVLEDELELEKRGLEGQKITKDESAEATIRVESTEGPVKTRNSDKVEIIVEKITPPSLKTEAPAQPGEATKTTTTKSVEKKEEEKLQISLEKLNVRQQDSKIEEEKELEDELELESRGIETRKVPPPKDKSTESTIKVEKIEEAEKASTPETVEITVEKITSPQEKTEAPTELGEATKTATTKSIGKKEQKLQISLEKLKVKEQELEDELELERRGLEARKISPPKAKSTESTIKVDTTDEAEKTSNPETVEIIVEKITSPEGKTKAPTELVKIAAIAATKSAEELEEEELEASVEKLRGKQQDAPKAKENVIQHEKEKEEMIKTILKTTAKTFKPTHASPKSTVETDDIVEITVTKLSSSEAKKDRAVDKKLESEERELEEEAEQSKENGEQTETEEKEPSFDTSADEGVDKEKIAEEFEKELELERRNQAKEEKPSLTDKTKPGKTENGAKPTAELTLTPRATTKSDDSEKPAVTSKDDTEEELENELEGIKKQSNVNTKRGSIEDELELIKLDKTVNPEEAEKPLKTTAKVPEKKTESKDDNEGSPTVPVMTLSIEDTIREEKRLKEELEKDLKEEAAEVYLFVLFFFVYLCSVYIQS